MNIKQILIKNTGVQMVTHAINVVLGLLLAMILSRYLGVERFGELGYVFAFYYFFLALSDFGMNAIVIRECSKDRDGAPEIIGTILCFKIIVSLFSVIAAWGVIEVLQFPAEVKTTLYIYSLMLPMVALQLPAVIFQVVLRMEYPALMGLVKSVLNFLVVLFAVSKKQGLNFILAGYVATEFIVCGITWFFSKRYITLKFTFNTSLWKKVLKSSVPLGITALLVALISRADFIMLERMTDLRQVGFYAAAYRITSLAESLPIMIMATFFPLMSLLSVEDKPRLAKLFVKSTLLLGGLGILLGLGVTILAPWIVRTLFGPEFAETVAGLKILIWATVFLYFAISAGYLLISLGREKFNLITNAGAAFLNIGLNFVFIPKMGFKGAALATAITYLCIFIATLFGAFYALRYAQALPNQKKYQ